MDRDSAEVFQSYDCLQNFTPNGNQAKRLSRSVVQNNIIHENPCNTFGNLVKGLDRLMYNYESLCSAMVIEAYKATRGCWANIFVQIVGIIN